MQKLKAVVFDLDGTLLNTLDDLAAAVNYSLQAHGFPRRTVEEVQSFVGNGVERLIALSVPKETDAAVCREVLAAFKAYYAVHGQDVTAPYSGIIEMLETLQQAGIAMALVSNKLEEAVEQLRAHFFASYITVAAGDRPDRRRKPAPDSTFAALEALGVSPEEALFVGDSDVDIETARRAGMPCLSVSWGFRDGDFLRKSGATTVVDSPKAATAVILSMC